MSGSVDKNAVGRLRAARSSFAPWLDREIDEHARTFRIKMLNDFQNFGEYEFASLFLPRFFLQGLSSRLCKTADILCLLQY